MNSFDAIIVGAGPAGSTCAAQLKKNGLNVKLFDKKVFPRVKPCAGWVTPQVIEALQIDIDDYRRNNTFQPITGFRTGLIGGRSIETNYRRPVSFGIRRIEFDNYLLERSGVPCDFSAVKQIEPADDGWCINHEHFAPLIVGAGGHFCPVARFVRSQHTKNNQSATSSTTGDKGQSNPVVVYAQEIEFEVPASGDEHTQVDPERPELYFCPDLRGYGWCFRKGNFLNIGLGRIEKRDLSSHVEAFCQFLKSRERFVGEIPNHFLGHAYKLYADSVPKLHDEGLLLIGDSAGLAYPNSGEGIRPAVESALIAADVIVNSRGDYRASSLESYQKRLVQRFGKPKPHQVAAWLPAAWLQSIAAGLMATRWFAKHLVVDDWFLHRKQSTLRI